MMRQTLLISLIAATASVASPADSTNVVETSLTPAAADNNVAVVNAVGNDNVKDAEIFERDLKERKERQGQRNKSGNRNNKNNDVDVTKTTTEGNSQLDRMGKTIDRVKDRQQETADVDIDDGSGGGGCDGGCQPGCGGLLCRGCR